MKKRKTMLQNLNIYQTIHKFDKWGCWCDYLRLCYKEESDFIEDTLELLDCDNSNFKTEEICDHVLTITKDYNKLWYSLNFSISYNDVSVPIAQFVKFNQNTSYNTKSYWKFDFYGSLFRLIDMWFVDKSLILLLKVKVSSENPKVTRFDYRFDFFSMKNKKVPAPEEFLNYIHVQAKIRDFKFWNWDYQSWDYWKSSKKWNKNNRYALRYYNKLDDSDDKNKIFLYQDYFMYNSVHRFEIEFQPNFLKGYTFYDFYDWLIQDKIESLLWLSERMFRWPLFYQYQSDYTLKDKDKVKYLKTYCSMSVRLAKNWINPLIQCYKSLFYNLDVDDLNKNFWEFLEFFSDWKNLNTLLYNKLKNTFLKNHTI